MNQRQLQVDSRLPVILVVDDNPAIRDMLSWALELDGYEPAEAAEGQEALNWINEAAREGCYPAVILLDLTMPGMNGQKFLAQLRQQWDSNRVPQPAIVVITADRTSLNAANLGVDQVIAKPFHVRDLLDAVRLLTRV